MAEEKTREEPAPSPPAEGPARRPRVGVLVGFLVAFLLLLVLFHEVLFPFLMAIFIAYLIEPVVAAVTKSPVFGVRWTRGPTIIAMYVVVLGGMVLVSSCAVAQVTSRIRDVSATVRGHLADRAERATFHLRPTEAEGGAPTAPPLPYEQDVLIPAGTLVDVRPHGLARPAPGTEPGEASAAAPAVFSTLYDVVLPAGQVEAPPVLLRATREPVPPAEAAVGTILTPEGVKFSDGRPVADVARIHVASSEPAVGLEVVLERTLITPIVENLKKVGVGVEPTLLREVVSAQAKGLGEGLPERVTTWTRQAIGRIALSIYEFILILMLTAFLVLDRRRIAHFFASLPPPRYAATYHSLIRYVDRGLAGVIRGQLVICVVNGLLTYLGLVFLGVKGSALLAFIAGVLSLIPIFGTVLSSIPIVLLAATDSIEKGLLALGWIALIHLAEANLLNPLIMGSHARMHPVIIVFALLAGEHYFGVWGALLAVPTMSILQSSFQWYRHEVEGLPWDDEPAHGDRFRGLLRRVFGRRRPEAGA